MSRKKADPTPLPRPPERKPLRTMREFETPPLSAATAGVALAALLRVCDGEDLPSGLSEPMKSIGKRCHELRLSDEAGEWRFFYQTHPDHVLLIDWVHKKTQQARAEVIARCKQRVKSHEAGIAEAEREARRRAKRGRDKPRS